MSLIEVTAPTEEPITLTEAKAHLRVDGSDEDALITSLITAARQHIDGRDGWLNRALVTQIWDLKLDRFCNPIRVPLPPLVSVDSVKYLDLTGAEQTLSSSLYRVTGVGSALKAEIRPAFDTSWPSVKSAVESVTVRFTAGYGAASAVPEPIKSAMYLLIGHWFEHREQVTLGANPTMLPFAVQNLLMPYRNFG